MRSKLVAVFPVHGMYSFALVEMPDAHEGIYPTKDAAMEAARAFQREHGVSEKEVLDYTNKKPSELGEFLR